MSRVVAFVITIYTFFAASSSHHGCGYMSTGSLAREKKKERRKVPRIGVRGKEGVVE